MIESAENEQDRENAAAKLSWDEVPTKSTSSADLVWEPLTLEQASTPPEELVWSEPTDPSLDAAEVAAEAKKQDSADAELPELAGGLRWPNGQLMSPEDQVYFRSAWSRGSMVQIGDTVYPNIGMNALQRAPGSWVEIGITAIDDSWQWFGIDKEPEECSTGNFLSRCSDGLMENRFRIFNSDLFSAELVWTMHSLSGEGAPYSFTVGDNTFGGEVRKGTAFGDGQSIGFRLSKNFGKTFGISAGGSRLFHLDDTTDLSKPLYLLGTKVFRLSESIEPPIISVSLGLMSDVYNPDTNIGTIEYPSWLLGGNYRSMFSQRLGFDEDKRRRKRGGGGGNYYPNVAGVSSAFVCAEKTVFAGKKPTEKHKDCIKQVFVAPVGSIGFAPWPWLGFYANFTRNLNLGISLKPFKNLNWNISAHMISPIVGLNSRQDLSIQRNRCPDDTSFSACRTRIGLWTELSF